MSINGKDVKPKVINEHILIKRASLTKGLNNISIFFTAGNQSLNRRDNLLYTLLVPDRARTLFPCFDQPDIKALYNLSLEVPHGWEAVANGKVILADTLDNQRVLLKFSTTEPISTYLFSFVAGVLNKTLHSDGKRDIWIYHRETDKSRIDQTDEIARLIFSSLQWMEEYTGIEYPFTKYDIVIIPGFQYGGMEHMGATLYSDRTMFLEPGATINEKMSRAKLIAHETAHMWFGDYVTMTWFDDVWTKEVFANWFASAMVSPHFPEIDHQFNFVNTFFPPAYAEERTPGTNPVKQELDNLNKAGLVYGNIIYNKAPIVMEKLVRKIGEDKFREGIKVFLSKYAYANASWEDLIAILDSLTDEDLTSWSRVWIEERGRPHIRAEKSGEGYLYHQQDPFNRGIIWEQEIVSRKILNSDGMGYALFILKEDESQEYFNRLIEGDIKENISRLSVLINLYENMHEGWLTPQQFVSNALQYISKERNIILFSRAAGYIVNAFHSYLNPLSDTNDNNLVKEAEKVLWSIVTGCEELQIREVAFRTLLDIWISPEITRTLYGILEEPSNFKLVNLGERDLMRLSYELALRMPDKYQEIRDIQLSGMNNADRIKGFKFIYPSVSQKAEVRDSVFNSLRDPLNRVVEPWVLEVMGYLNHFLMRDNSHMYIVHSLEMLEDIQKTGDIFFPVNWLRALYRSHLAGISGEITTKFLNDNPGIDPLLKLKILQQSSHLFREDKR